MSDKSNRNQTTIFLVLQIGLFILCVSFLMLAQKYVEPQASMDSAYYHILTDQLEKGNGFVEPFVWHHLNKYDSVSHPVDYWMPLGILAYFIARVVGGVPAEIGLNIFLWALLSVLVFRQVNKLTNNLFASIVAFFVFAFAGKFLFYLLTTDNIVFYAFLGFALISALSRNDDNPLSTGILAGMITLTRIEGIIFAFFAFLIEVSKTKKAKTGLLFVIAFALVILPWAVRNKITLDRWWPSNTKALFLRDYSELFSEEYPGTIQHFLGLGGKEILKQKFQGLWNSLLNFVAVPAFFIFYPLWILGLIRIWKGAGKVFSFFITLFWLLCGILFTHQGIKGTSMHISAFFLPHMAIITGVGFDFLIKEKKLGKKLTYSLGILIVLWALGFSIVSVNKLGKRYEGDNGPYKKLFSKCTLPEDAKIVSVYPIYVYYLSGIQGVISVLPKGPESLARKFSCNYILTDKRVKIEKLPDEGSWTEIASNTELTLYKKK